MNDAKTDPPAQAGQKLGARLKCSVCGAQAVVTKASQTAGIQCHGRPLETPFSGAKAAS